MSQLANPANAFSILQEAFGQMALKPNLEVQRVEKADGGDMEVVFSAKRWEAWFGSTFRARLNQSGKIRAFADQELLRIRSATGPSDQDLSRLDATAIVQSCKNELKGLVPNVHSTFPRYAFYSPASGHWRVLLMLVTKPKTGLRQYEFDVGLHGRVLAVRRLPNAI